MPIITLSRVLCLTLLLASTGSLNAAGPGVSRTERLSDDLDITLTTYPAEGDYLLLWIAGSAGFRNGHQQLGTRLAQQGISVWLADITDALFLPRSTGSLRELDGRYVADLIERAHAVTGKKIALVSSFYGAIPVLRGAHTWQNRRPKTPYLVGAVLFSPSTYATVPSLGLEPAYVPVVQATSIPVMIFQGEMASNRWRLPNLLESLQQGGSATYSEIMPDVVSLFYDEQPSPAALAYLERLPGKFARILPLLEKTATPLQAIALTEPAAEEGIGLDVRIKPYRGDSEPHPLQLPDVSGRPFEIMDYRGKVTVVNFWATWCSPCVEEIPSLNRLREAMKDEPFRLISVNYAEGPATIQDFMHKVDVDFPVLIDEDGSEAAKWKVIVFPSTFIIGPDGRIHYGANAAIKWDAPEIIATLRALGQSVDR